MATDPGEPSGPSTSPSETAGDEAGEAAAGNDDAPPAAFDEASEGAAGNDDASSAASAPPAKTGTNDEAEGGGALADSGARTGRRARTAAPTVYVVGFWRRLGGALIDSLLIVAVSLVLGWLAGAVSGIHLPPSRYRGPDFWLDLLLTNDPAFVGWLGLTLAVGAIYLMLFQATMARTLGMRAVKTRIIDLYGDAPTIPRAALRTAGYVLGLATLGLGFVWVAFDPEKRGVHDWLAGTYLIRD